MEIESKQLVLNYRVKEKISFKEKLSYGMGGMADALVWSSISAFGTYYYTNSAGLAAAAIGTMFLVSRIISGISDIIMGMIIDRTHSKYGKARPWLLWMAIPYAIATILLFSIPQSFSPGAKLVYAYITYNLVSSVLYPAIIQPYGTMSTLITDNVEDRTQLTVGRMAIQMFSVILLNFLVMPLVNAFGNTPSAWTKAFAVLAPIAAGILIITFLNTKERIGEVAPETESIDEKKKALPIGVSLKTLVTNKYWVNRVLFGMMITIATATTGVNIYYASYWLNNNNAVGILSLANVIPMIISLVLVTPLAAKLGKKMTVQLGVSVMIAGIILQLIAPTNMLIIMIGYAIRGFGTGLATALSGVLLGDTIDYSEWKNGFRTEGLIFSAATIGTKIGSGLGAGILGWALAWGGFNAAATTQTSGAMTAIIAVFTYIPLLVSVIAFLLNLVYDLDKKMPQILNDLNERNAAQG